MNAPSRTAAPRSPSMGPSLGSRLGAPLRSALGSALAVALAAGFAAGSAQAQTKTLYIGMNGGTMEQSYTKYVFPAFERIHGVKVVVVPGSSSDILAKVLASK